MKIRRLWVVAMLCAGLTAHAAQTKDDKDTDLTGNWATEASRNAVPDVKSSGLVGQIVQKTVDTGVGKVPTGTGGRGGRMPTRGPGVTIDSTPPKVIEKGSSPDGVALTMELKLSKSKNKATLTGSVKEVVSGVKADIEDVKLDGQKFEFTTYKKVNNMGIGTVYKGELVSPKIIQLTRWTTNGKAVDVKPDGTQEVLVFERGKKE